MVHGAGAPELRRRRRLPVGPPGSTPLLVISLYCMFVSLV